MLTRFYQQKEEEAGCDEAGRGCLAGPVFAAAVILPHDFQLPFLNDSKKLSEKKRYLLRPEIENQAVAWSVAQISSNEIDEINILRASIKAMHLAISHLQAQPTFLLIDGNRFYSYPGIPHKCIVKGDSKYASIAAASILAKTYRDDYMKKIHAEFPKYNWMKNKGYPTLEHREALRTNGISVYHRKTFRLFNQQTIIPFSSKF